VNIDLATASLVDKEIHDKPYLCPCNSKLLFPLCHGRLPGTGGGVPEEQFYPEFTAFRKIPRWKRTIVVSEKIDGTNAQLFFDEAGRMFTGSRNRWITPAKDNAGFSRWAYEHEEELRALGQGHHFGEWYGLGIQRGYGLKEKRFALFNSSRWTAENPPPACCQVVPVLYDGVMSEERINACVDSLRASGSVIAPGFDKPEGIVIYHVASGTMHKRTLENDESPKGQSEDKKDDAS